ncbi:putative disease resistance protein RGA4 [Juglans microcarpa x Juglans regia]|uniref:putative disease resistance protein RGA4 n=1 Tax=Juglans microcarpa x Juglans regia TaxID=2249226 RepID=UPI001B7F1C3C|nr:putative disease resistance protein RGA4 [Juglans microcarpa x Juglans regia]
MPELAFLIAEKVLEELEFLDFFLPWELESDIRKLEGTVSAIQAVLLDAEEKQASIPPLNLWLGRLKGILYDAEDMLDEMEGEAFFITCGSTGTKVRSFSMPSMPSMPLPFHPKQGDRIRNIRERLDEIAADKDRFNFTVRLDDRHFVHWKRDMGHTFVDPREVIGRRMDQEKLIDLLMHPAGSKVNVIPIVGFGGVGKTTLAKLVYNDERVVQHFELKIWVQVSEDFDNSRLIKKILNYSAREMVLDEDVITYWLIFEKLMDKRYILVLDDVRNLDYYKWIHLINMFYGESEGSKVIVTTHGSSIAPTMDTVSQYSLEGLYL